VWDTVSHEPITSSDVNYGYANSTTEDATLTTSHSVTVSGLAAGTTYFLRPVSHGSPEVVGAEVSVSTSNPPPAPSVSSGGGGGGGGGGGNGPIVGSFGAVGGSVLGASTGPTALGLGTTSNSIIPTSNQSAVVSTQFKFREDLWFGMRANDVTELQMRLTAEGVYAGPITGYFGSLTRAAVMKYQANHGISAIGRVGPRTRASLNGEPMPTERVSSASSQGSGQSGYTNSKPKAQESSQTQDTTQSQTGAVGATESTTDTSGASAPSSGGFWGFVSKLLRGK